jgi:hypothetical protein
MSSRWRLRLTARALIEWRTPISSITYREVLDELIAVNPLATSIGITPQSRILKYDDQGVVLWYLSETLKSEVPRPDTFENWPMTLQLRAEEVIYRYGRAGVNDTELWEKGPMKSQIAEGIVRGITRGKQSAFWALIAILLALGIQDRKRYILRLLEEEQIFYGFIQRLSRRIQKVYRISQDVQRVLSVVTLAAAVFEIIRNEGVLRKGVLNPLTIAGAATMAASASVTYVIKSGTIVEGYLEVVRGVRRVGLRWLRSAKSLVRKMFGVGIDGERVVYRRRRRGYRFGRACYRLLRRADGFVRQNMLDHVKRLKHESRKRQRRGRQKKSDSIAHWRFDAYSADQLSTECGKFCGSQPQVLRNVMLFGRSWIGIVLNATKQANIEVVRELLSLVRSPRLDWPLRYRLLTWLFSVDVIEHTKP